MKRPGSSKHLKYAHKFRSLVAVVVVVPASLCAQECTQTVAALYSVAAGILANASFDFVVDSSGQQIVVPESAPQGAHLRPASPYNDWRYWNGVLNIAMMRLGNVLHDSSYERFAEKNISFGFDNVQYFEKRYRGENKWSYPFGQLFKMEELDDCGAMGASVIKVYEQERQLRYLEYIDRAANHIENVQARLDDRTLVRAFPRRWTLWADDLYMGVSFLARMGRLTGRHEYFDDAARQVINFHKYLFDATKGLMYHCWFSDTKQHGIALWGRANGWAMVAQVDLLDEVPKDYAYRDTLLSLLRRDVHGLVRYQDKSGLWHQLLDKQDSYLETSCTAMFTYAIARSVDKGYVDTVFASSARKGWQGVLTRIRPDGKIEGVCTGTGVGDSLGFYYKRPTPLNDVHGIGAVILAGTEILLMSD